MLDSEDVLFAGHRKGLADRDCVSRCLGLFRLSSNPEEGDVARVDIPENGALRLNAVKASNVPPIGAGKTEAAEGARHTLSGISARREQYPQTGAAQGCSLTSVESTCSRVQRIA